MANNKLQHGHIIFQFINIFLRMKRNRAMAKVSGTEGVVLQKLFAVKFQHPSKELALIGVIVLNV